MKKKTRIEYKELKALPYHAQRVSDYAKEQDISVWAVYKRHKANKIKIITFKGYNWVI